MSKSASESIDFAGGGVSAVFDDVAMPRASKNRVGTSSMPNSINAPFESLKRAGRHNASRVTKQEEDALIAERVSLLDSFFAGTLTPKDASRLEYVRWSLDRIEDARIGFELDALEQAVDEYETVMLRLDELERKLKTFLRKG